MRKEDELMVYWDASAILSALFEDERSKESLAWASKKGVHLMSTLASAEAYAVIRRIEREGYLEKRKVDVALEDMEKGPWRQLNIQPDWATIKALSGLWPLRGADLWHLATAMLLRERIPELVFLTFDRRLNIAAEGQGMRTGAG
jgi:predicted nucleic acid-binding protein